MSCGCGCDSVDVPVGPTGPQGTQGTQGNQGPQGTQGTQGPQGSQGATATGATIVAFDLSQPDSGDTGGIAVNLFSDTIPANTWGADGDRVEIECVVRNNDEKVVGLVNQETVVSFGLTGASGFSFITVSFWDFVTQFETQTFRFVVERISSTEAHIQLFFSSSDVAYPPQDGGRILIATGLDFTQTTTFQLQAQNTIVTPPAGGKYITMTSYYVIKYAA